MNSGPPTGHGTLVLPHPPCGFSSLPWCLALARLRSCFCCEGGLSAERGGGRYLESGEWWWQRGCGVVAGDGDQESDVVGWRGQGVWC